MNVELIFSLGLALLILAVAGFVIVARGSFAAIVGFVAYGLLLSLAWMGLSAPDVALTEAALGGGVTGALLLGACARLRSVNDVGKAARANRAWRGSGTLPRRHGRFGRRRAGPARSRAPRLRRRQKNPLRQRVWAMR